MWLKSTGWLAKEPLACRTECRVDRVALSRSQRNVYNGVLQDSDASLYLIGKTYRFRPLNLPRFVAALEATILSNPAQLCVLELPATGDGYPDLVLRLQVGDIVRVWPEGQQPDGQGEQELTRMWISGIIDKPLVRYTVWTDAQGCVSGLDVYSHHIVVDGGGTGIIEADLARHLSPGDRSDIPCIKPGLAKLAEAHRHEASKIEESTRRLADVVQRELADEARLGGCPQSANAMPVTAAKGVRQESVTISGAAFDAILALSEAKQVPLNVLVTAAALAVDASLRQSTGGLLVHAVDNRFGDPELNVATCLVNSVAHSFRFAPFASVQEVVRLLDRGYVKAVRRRWLREEHYRRMYLAINRTSHVQALTLNFIRESCAPALRPFLREAPVATDIGPVEGTTVATVLDEGQRTLDIAIWNRADLPEADTGVAQRIAAALESMPALWDQPIAMTADEWLGLGQDGVLTAQATEPARPTATAWFLAPEASLDQFLERRRYVYPWVAWLVRNGCSPGDVVVFTDDNTDKTIDCMIACHLAGCGYSVCDAADKVQLRANAIAEHAGGVSAHVVDTATDSLSAELDAEGKALVDERIALVAQDVSLAEKTAYLMPTSGSTGQPKLVRIVHGSLALFCDAVRRAYDWGPRDVIMQCAPLTSDISVEEIFGSAFCGSGLIRTTTMKSGDLDGLVRGLATAHATVVDLPTAVWHLLCDDDAMEALDRSGLRQIVIGGEAVRPAAVNRWMESAAAQTISLVSTYGPTETTVVVTCLSIVRDGTAQPRLGRPMVPGTVFVAFGEVVIVGELVSTGYLGREDLSFGTVTAADGSQRRAFATADRVTLDSDGFPTFSGRKDDVVKVSGKRIDIAEVTRRMSADPAVSDVAVELHDGSLGVWFQYSATCGTVDDVATRIRHILVSSGVSSFFVVEVPKIPRKPSGKVDSDKLRTMPQFVDAVPGETVTDQDAVGLAQVWSRQLGIDMGPDSSLLGEGIGSLDLIRILPDTRKYLGRQVTVLDLISADTAANLIADFALAATTVDHWMDDATAVEIRRDLDGLGRRVWGVSDGNLAGDGPIVVLGASGILGTGFAGAILDLRRSGMHCPEVILASRSELPERDPWTALRRSDGVRIERLPAHFGAAELDALIRDTGARTVVNCIGNTNVLVAYRELRTANVDLVSAIVEVCASHGTRLVHMSTFVVNADVAVPEVVDPRFAPYPYAASKSLAELVVAASPEVLDFTLVRLPRVLGEDYQLRDSTDILVSVVDACVALGARPALSLTEEVTTGRAAATAILGLVPEFSGATELGRGITVACGESVDYATLLSGFAPEELDVAEWKRRLDASDWAKENPRRWSVVDAWVSLGMRLGGRSYAEYLADHPTVAVGNGLVAPSESVQTALGQDCSDLLSQVAAAPRSGRHQHGREHNGHSAGAHRLNDVAQSSAP